MLAEFSAVVASVKTLGDIIRTAVDLKASSEIALALSRVQEDLLSAQGSALESQEKISSLLSEIDGLKEELRHIKNWDERVKGYELTTATGGAVVYRFKGEPEHYVCPSCFEKGAVQILQDKRLSSGYFQCSSCKVDYPVKPMPNFQHQKNRVGGY